LAEVDIQENFIKVSGWLDAKNLILNGEKITPMGLAGSYPLSVRSLFKTMQEIGL
jgi:hypothetical protein